MSGTQEPVGTLATALQQAAKLLGPKPALAEEQAREILKAVPGHPEALLLLAMARARQGDAADALAILEPLAKSQPKAPAVHFEMGMAHASLGNSEGAIAALKQTVRLKPDHAEAWRALGDEFTLAGGSAPASAGRR